jgi:hypothetical protein
MNYNPHRKTKFVVTKDYIDLRTSTGQYLCSVCCPRCVKSLERAILKLKKLQINDKKRKVE